MLFSIKIYIVIKKNLVSYTFLSNSCWYMKSFCLLICHFVMLPFFQLLFWGLYVCLNVFCKFIRLSVCFVIFCKTARWFDFHSWYISMYVKYISTFQIFSLFLFLWFKSFTIYAYLSIYFSMLKLFIIT